MYSTIRFWDRFHEHLPFGPDWDPVIVLGELDLIQLQRGPKFCFRPLTKQETSPVGFRMIENEPLYVSPFSQRVLNSVAAFIGFPISDDHHFVIYQMVLFEERVFLEETFIREAVSVREEILNRGRGHLFV